MLRCKGWVNSVIINVITEKIKMQLNARIFKISVNVKACMYTKSTLH